MLRVQKITRGFVKGSRLPSIYEPHALTRLEGIESTIAPGSPTMA